MQITLRRASAVGMSIKTYLKANRIVVQGTVSRFDEPATQLVKLQESLTKGINDTFQLLEILEEIRSKVSDANQRSGIPTILCEKAKLEGVIATINIVLSNEARADSSTVFMKKWEAMKKRAEESTTYNLTDTLSVGLVDEATSETMAKRLRDVKTRLRAIDEVLLEVNIKNLIEINSDSEMTLKSLGLL